MANPYPARIIDESGVERIVGEVDFSDPGNQPGGTGPVQSGVASPVGAVVPLVKGALYVETGTPTLWQASDATNAGWVVVGGFINGGGGVTVKGVSVEGQFSVFDADAAAMALFVQGKLAAGTVNPRVLTGKNTLDDGTALASAQFLSGLGVWNHAAPGAQPATPVLLADVIAVLQAYGLCA